MKEKETETEMDGGKRGSLLEFGLDKRAREKSRQEKERERETDRESESGQRQIERDIGKRKIERERRKRERVVTLVWPRSASASCSRGQTSAQSIPGPGSTISNS